MPRSVHYHRHYQCDCQAQFAQLKELIMGLQETVDAQAAAIATLSAAVTNNTAEIAALVAQLSGGVSAEQAAAIGAQIEAQTTSINEAVAALAAADPTP